jgi:hypothetical protein
MSAQIIRFPGHGEPPEPGDVRPDDLSRLGFEVFKGGIYLGTVWRTREGITAASAWQHGLGEFPNLESAADAIFAAALR